jgi:hypothetical protein
MLLLVWVIFRWSSPARLGWSLTLRRFPHGAPLHVSSGSTVVEGRKFKDQQLSSTPATTWLGRARVQRRRRLRASLHGNSVHANKWKNASWPPWEQMTDSQPEYEHYGWGSSAVARTVQPTVPGPAVRIGAVVCTDRIGSGFQYYILHTSRMFCAHESNLPFWASYWSMRHVNARTWTFRLSAFYGYTFKAWKCTHKYCPGVESNFDSYIVF